MKIAITGSIGSGKSSVGAYLRAKGFTVIDTDKLVHSFYHSSGILYDAILDVFSINILDDSGEIDRAKLGEIVFKDALALNDLESIVFPPVADYIMSYPNLGVVFFEVPMLFESHMDSLFDSILMINTDRNLSLDRLILRGVLREDAIVRLDLQMDPEEKVRKSDSVIHNNGSLEELYLAVDLYIKEKGYEYDYKS